MLVSLHSLVPEATFLQTAQKTLRPQVKIASTCRAEPRREEHRQVARRPRDSSPQALYQGAALTFEMATEKNPHRKQRTYNGIE